MILNFVSGWSFEIENFGGALSIVSSSRSENENTINGLMGNFDNNPNNDLMTPEGKIIDSASNLSTIHWEFGIKWMITQEESIFYYSLG